MNLNESLRSAKYILEQRGAQQRTKEEQQVSRLLKKLKKAHRKKPIELAYDNPYMPCPNRRAAEVILRQLDVMLNKKIGDPYTHFLFELDSFSKEESSALITAFDIGNGGIAQEDRILMPV